MIAGTVTKRGNIRVGNRIIVDPYNPEHDVIVGVPAQKYRFVRGKNKGNHIQKTLSNGKQPGGSNGGGAFLLVAIVVIFFLVVL